MKRQITNPFFIAAACFLGGTIFITWLWFGLFDFGDFWTWQSNGILPFSITRDGKIGLLIEFICGGLAFTRGWAFCRWH